MEATVADLEQKLAQNDFVLAKVKQELDEQRIARAEVDTAMQTGEKNHLAATL